MATDWTVRGSNSRGGWDFPHPSRPAQGAHPASCTMGTWSFPGVKSGRGLTLTHHPLLVPRSWNSRAIPLLPLWAVRPVQSLSACTRIHFTFLPFTRIWNGIRYWSWLGVVVALPGNIQSCYWGSSSSLVIFQCAVHVDQLALHFGSGPTIWGLNPREGKVLLNNIQTGSGVHTASRWMGTGILSSGSKASTKV